MSAFLGRVEVLSGGMPESMEKAVGDGGNSEEGGWGSWAMSGIGGAISSRIGAGSGIKERLDGEERRSVERKEEARRSVERREEERRHVERSPVEKKYVFEGSRSVSNSLAMKEPTGDAPGWGAADSAWGDSWGDDEPIEDVAPAVFATRNRSFKSSNGEMSLGGSKTSNGGNKTSHGLNSSGNTKTPDSGMSLGKSTNGMILGGNKKDTWASQAATKVISDSWGGDDWGDAGGWDDDPGVQETKDKITEARNKRAKEKEAKW